MRRKSFILVVLFWVVLASLSLTIPYGALAVEYLGQFKWKIVPEETGTSETLVTGVTQIGDNFYSVQGYLEPSDGDGILVYDGGAMIKDGTIYMTLHMTHTHELNQCKDAQTWRITVDYETFSGSYWVLGGSYCDEVEYSDFDEGTISLIDE